MTAGVKTVGIHSHGLRDPLDLDGGVVPVQAERKPRKMPLISPDSLLLIHCE